MRLSGFLVARATDTNLQVQPAEADATVIRSPLPYEYAAVAQAVVSVGALTQAVKETLNQVKEVVNARGGRL